MPVSAPPPTKDRLLAKAWSRSNPVVGKLVTDISVADFAATEASTASGPSADAELWNEYLLRRPTRALALHHRRQLCSPLAFGQLQ